MYTQFFGNYLLSNGYVTKKDLLSAMQRQSDCHLKLGTLAIHAGYMTAKEVDDTVIQQTHQDRKFGELAVERGYLTEEQVTELLSSQKPSFLSLGQILIDDGILNNIDFEKIMYDYHAKNGMEGKEDLAVEQQEIIHQMFSNFFEESETSISHNGNIYIELLFNDFIRFIGDVFTPLSIEEVPDAPVSCCVKQEVHGEYAINTYISMDEATAIEFASRYANEEFESYDEFVKAALEDFLNLQNGLFTVNISNDSSTELTLSAPKQIEEGFLSFTPDAIHIPILYSFGIMDVYIEPVKIQ